MASRIGTTLEHFNFDPTKVQVQVHHLFGE